jgi:hypothetical protein
MGHFTTTHSFPGLKPLCLDPFIGGDRQFTLETDLPSSDVIEQIIIGLSTNRFKLPIVYRF